MASDHVPPDRIRQFMLSSLELTEEESEHINDWKCPECYQTMRSVVGEESSGNANPSDERHPPEEQD
jgi:hypothetical protein